jgi:hypothetical protein
MPMSDKDLIVLLQEENAFLRNKLLSQTQEYAHLTKAYYAHISKINASMPQVVKMIICRIFKLYRDEQK